MSAEAYQAFERISDQEQQIHGVEAAAKSIARIRLLLEEKYRLRKLEADREVVDLDMVRQLEQAIAELEGELEDVLAFLEEFDPVLYQTLKDNS